MDESVAGGVMPFSCTQQAELKKHRPNYFLRNKRASLSFIVRTTRETRTLFLHTGFGHHKELFSFLPEAKVHSL